MKRFQIKEKIMRSKKARIVSLFLLFVGTYLVLYPLVPNVLYFLRLNRINVFPYRTQLEQGSVEGNDSQFENKNIPDENRIVIPAIHVDLPIVEGSNDTVLDLGVWHRPNTGTPGHENMVLTGHRVGYAFLPNDIKNSMSFYHLDKLKDGDFVIIYWNGVEYDYQIYNKNIVENSDMSVENQDGEERLTLYTCHPLGSNAKRLVYVAHRIDEDRL